MAEVERLLTILPTAAIARKAWEDYGEVIICELSLFEYPSMPLGIKTAAAWFQRCIDLTFDTLIAKGSHRGQGTILQQLAGPPRRRTRARYLQLPTTLHRKLRRPRATPLRYVVARLPYVPKV